MASLQGKRIFIVEDNTDNRVIAQLLLEQAGAKVAFERWGKDTVQRMHLFKPIDIVLLDLMLADNMSGFDIYDRIREADEFATIPIVAVSASDTSSAVPKAREKGFSGYISKPIDFLQFANQVAAVLKGEQVWKFR